MTSPTALANDGYILKRGFAASARLNLMHYLWKEQAGYLLHPRVQYDPETVAIAEIGTGTGIWLLDLARTLPASARLDGFDISLAQCPSKEWLPPNVSLSVLDSLGEVPEHLLNQYDVIHIRHFLLVVKNNDPGPVIRNLLRMLKPGGYIQWGEMDFGTIRFLGARSESSTKNIETLYNYIRNVGGKADGQIRDRSHWPATLDKAFEHNEVVNVTVDRLSYEQAYLSYQLDTGLMTWEELTYMVIDPVDTEKGKIARQLILKAYEEGRDGGAWDADRVIVIGRKAS